MCVNGGVCVLFEHETFWYGIMSLFFCHLCPSTIWDGRRSTEKCSYKTWGEAQRGIDSDSALFNPMFTEPCLWTHCAHAISLNIQSWQSLKYMTVMKKMWGSLKNINSDCTFSSSYNWAVCPWTQVSPQTLGPDFSTKDLLCVQDFVINNTLHLW